MWDQNPMDLESLSSMRRSFHTLKGSGRMVGARSIAEFAWSIENLLNRIIDKTLSRTPGMMALAAQCGVAALPQLVEQLETGRPASAADRGVDGARLRLSPTAAIPSRTKVNACARGPLPDPMPTARPRAGAAPSARDQSAGHGCRAARDLQQGDLESSDGDPRIPAQARRVSPRRTICRNRCIAPFIP